MAKKMSKRKTNAIILCVTLTLVMVLLGGVIAAVVTETNPKDWFKQEIQYSELGEDMVKEYDAVYLDTTREGLKQIKSLFDGMEPDSMKTLAYIGDTTKSETEFEDFMLRAMYIGVENESGGETYVQMIVLLDIASNDGIVVYCNKEITYNGDTLVEGFQNLGEDGLLEFNDDPISGAIAQGDVDLEDYNIISINPVK